MFSVKLEVNGHVIKKIDAVRQSDRAFGYNDYLVYDGNIPTAEGGRKLLGKVVHKFEDGASVLAKILLIYVGAIEETNPGHRKGLPVRKDL